MNKVPFPWKLKKDYFMEGIRWDYTSIATQLWMQKTLHVSEDTQKRIQTAEDYLSRLGFELKGVNSDGNCFFYAFYESYKTIKDQRKIPLLDFNEDPPKFLRETLASLFRNVSGKQHLKDEIEQDRRFVTASEGAQLAHHFNIYLRIITPGETGEVMDLLHFPERSKEAQTWKTVEEKPGVYIFIIDLGGHFVYATPKSTPPQKTPPPNSYPLQGRIFQLLFLLGAAFILYQVSKRFFATRH